MNENIITAIIAAVVSLLTGGGGVFVYLNSKQKTKQAAHDSAVSEWKTLYEEMKKRLDSQEAENRKLYDEVFELKETVNNLTMELQNYKKYDTYINELEKYVEHLLNTIKGVSTEDAYRNLNAKKPRRNIVNVN